MAEEIVMPRLSDSMEEGTVLSWLKSVGDDVAVGDELVEIETDKANMVYESDAAGTLIEIVADEGATLPIGDVIARVGEQGEAPSGNGASAEKPKDEAEEGTEVSDPEGGTEVSDPEGAGRSEDVAVAEKAEPAPAPEPSGDGRVKASPIAKRIASEKGLDIATLSGSGPGGRIVKADVERAVEQGPPTAPEAPAEAPERGPAPAAPTAGARERPETAKGEVEVVELTKLQQTVSRRMAESKATAPHFYLQAEIDMSRAVAARAKLKATTKEGDVAPSFNDMVVKASAIALREYPRANGAYRDGRLEQYSRINVGVAVAARDALVVPTVFDADRKGLREIATETRSLAQRVRDATVTPPELSGGTFTVSNLGMYGVSNFSAVINPPQAAILSVGAIAERPVARDGEIVTAQLMGVTLACDHRILYGADGAEFLARIRALLEEPLGLAL
jgi:pyruvate dehydrogenase E2 component (dihydrolipoamide acetyltransferase)